MNARLRRPRRIAALTAATALAGVTVGAPAFAADGDVQVVNTETVQVYTDATGEVKTKRIYEQIDATGQGTVELRNPVEPEGIRNLDGFGGFDVEGDQQVAQLTVDGEERLRTVSDYDGELPLDVNVEYYLDGELVEPGDVVGESGRLEVRYTVENVTSAPQEVTFDDGKGGTVTKTVEVPIPMVGSLTTVAPSSFTDVESKQANMAGDGRGGTKLSFTMTLFPPIGSDTAEFGYSANITDGVIPRASISALPVNPLESPSFKTAGESYKGGAETGIELTDGASQIDANLLKLRDGAADLLAGLIQLRNGSEELQAGLAGEAAPGAQRLAAGAAELDGGLKRIDDGAGQLADGAGRAADGGGQLADGAGRLSGGLGQLDAGVGDLSSGAKRLAAGQRGLEEGLTTLYQAVDKLPVSVQRKLDKNADYQSLLLGLQGIINGVGDRDDAPDAGTLLGGVNAIQYAMRFPGANDCQVALAGADPERCGAMDAVQLVAGLLSAGAGDLSAGAEDLTQLKQALQFLYFRPDGVHGAPCAAPAEGFLAPPERPTNACEMVTTVYHALFKPTDGAQDQVKKAAGSLTLASGALTEVYQTVDEELLSDDPRVGLNRLRAGLSNPAADVTECAAAKATATPADDCGIKQVAQAVNAGVPVLVGELVKSIESELLEGLGRPAANCDPEKTLRCAADALADGGGELVDGVNTLVSGVNQLAAGGNELSAGAGELANGLGTLQSGAVQLADGTGKASDGSGQLSDGANQLADGLGDAAEGSGRLADGLGQAAGGAPKLVDGAQRLSDEGTSKLVEAGESTAQNYGELYATIQAGAERAQAEKMVYGAPEDAFGLAAYSFEIEGEDGEGGRNLARGLGAAAILGLGAGAFALRRRVI